jgi:hypothetical protein
MCELVNGPPPLGALAAHSCGRGHDGCVDPRHLRWATYKLTAEQVAEIRSLRGKKTQRQIAEEYGISVGHVCSLQTGRRGGRWGGSEYAADASYLKKNMRSGRQRGVIR